MGTSPEPFPDVRRVYTDGACSGNPGPGGWAWIVPDGPFAAGFEPATTNQRMELAAVLEALRALPGPVEVVSDSTYVVNCFRDRWWEGWIKRGWKNAKKEPVANRDLWEPLVALVRTRGDVRFTWVKGHAGDRWNDLADRLAVEAALTGRARSGPTTPDEVGGPDTLRGARPGTVLLDGRRDPTGREPPEGHRLVVLGLRPRELGGYGPNAVADDVRRRLGEILTAKAALHPDLVVLSGLRQGAEMLAAEAADAAGLRWVAVLPYPEPDGPWPADARARFAELTARAADVVTLQQKAPTSLQSARGALGRRDAWFARNSHEAVVVWDGADDDVGRSVRLLRDALGEDEVWVLDVG